MLKAHNATGRRPLLPFPRTTPPVPPVVMDHHRTVELLLEAGASPSSMSEVRTI